MIWAIAILYAIVFINFITQRMVNTLYGEIINKLHKRIKKLENQ